MGDGVTVGIDAAAEIASAYAGERSMQVDVDAVREATSGWYFPWLWSGMPEAGSSGLIVNKSTGRILVLGSAFPVDRDLHYYDRGYQSELYDLVVTAVDDVDRAVEYLLKVGPTKVVPSEKEGTVWRIPQRLVAAEIRERLRRLPCVFADVRLNGHLEVLDEVRQDGLFEFEAVPLSE